MKNKKKMKKIKKKMKKLEKALRRFDWSPEEHIVRFKLHHFDDVIGRYMDLFEEVSEADEIYSKTMEVW